MRLASELGIVLCERRISLAEFQCADEVFTTGTMGELTPVNEIDGRHICPVGSLETVYPGPVTARIQAAYRILTVEESIPLSTI